MTRKTLVNIKQIINTKKIQAKTTKSSKIRIKENPMPQGQKTKDNAKTVRIKPDFHWIFFASTGDKKCIVQASGDITIKCNPETAKNEAN